MKGALLSREGLSARVQPGSGPKVIWLHGYTLNSSVWLPLWQRLPGWTHIGIDLPGHGASMPADGTDRLRHWAERIAGLAAAEEAEHLVGFSFGGLVALQVAIDFPDMFRSLTLASPALAGGPVDPDAEARNRALHRLYRERGSGPWMTELWMSSPPPIFAGAAGHPALYRKLHHLVDNYCWPDLEEHVMDRLVETPQDIGRLQSLPCPTLVLIGEEDMTSFKRTAEMIYRAVPGCRRIYVTGAGHLCLLELPEVTASIVEDHFNRTSSEGEIHRPRKICTP
jgi:pimeloyl-ACP methyl ester carboxylesterase